MSHPDALAGYRRLKDAIFRIHGHATFEETAMEVFRFQCTHNELYRSFARLNNRTPDTVHDVASIPFLPIELFRQHTILTDTGCRDKPVTFLSSGTTGSVPSSHTVNDTPLYEESFRRSFNTFFGEITQYRIFALLPSYLEREGSSLVYMADHLIRDAGADTGGFFLDDFGELERQLMATESGRKTLLIGVTFALLDFASFTTRKFPLLTVIETGGMKGRRKELVRKELYEILGERLGVTNICSEYGMTELCSQAWSLKDGMYNTPPWMQVMIREMNDPFSSAPHGKTGGINVIDLANLGSCAFIATQDLGRKHPDGTFEVLGRFDESEMRGCNLMAGP